MTQHTQGFVLCVCVLELSHACFSSPLPEALCDAVAPLWLSALTSVALKQGSVPDFALESLMSYSDQTAEQLKELLLQVYAAIFVMFTSRSRSLPSAAQLGCFNPHQG